MDNVGTPTSFTQPAPGGPEKKSNKKLLIILLVVLILGVLGFVAFRNSQSSNQANQEEITPTEEPIPTEEPTPELSPTEEEAEPTRKPSATTAPTAGPVNEATDMRIQILNGTGETGVAGAARDHLSSKGYKSLETGNADNNDYTGVTVRVKESMKKYQDQLVTDLKSKYSSVETGSALSSDSTFDAQVIIGK